MKFANYKSFRRYVRNSRAEKTLWLLRGKKPACNAGDAGSIRGSERTPAGGNGNPPQTSRLGNPTEEEPGRSLAGCSPRGRKPVRRRCDMPAG